MLRHKISHEFVVSDLYGAVWRLNGGLWAGRVVPTTTQTTAAGTMERQEVRKASHDVGAPFLRETGGPL